MFVGDAEIIQTLNIFAISLTDVLARGHQEAMHCSHRHHTHHDAAGALDALDALFTTPPDTSLVKECESDASAMARFAADEERPAYVYIKPCSRLGATICCAIPSEGAQEQFLRNDLHHLTLQEFVAIFIYV